MRVLILLPMFFFIPQFGQHARRALRSYVGTVCEPFTGVFVTNSTADTFSTIHCGRPLNSALQIFRHLLQVMSRAGGAAGTVAPVHHGNFAGRGCPSVCVLDPLVAPILDLAQKDFHEKAAVKVKFCDLTFVIVLTCESYGRLHIEYESAGCVVESHRLRRKCQWHPGRVGSA